MQFSRNNSHSDNLENIMTHFKIDVTIKLHVSMLYCTVPHDSFYPMLNLCFSVYKFTQ